MRKRDDRRSLSEIGERSIIEIIKKHLDDIPASPVPFGDDVAAVTIQGERVAVLKTDMLVGKTDVPIRDEPAAGSAQSGRYERE